MSFEKLKFTIEKKESIIAIIGLGYVGLPLALRFSEETFRTIGFDIDQKKIDCLNKGKSYIKHIESKKIKKSKTYGFSATSDFSRISEVQSIIICVPTPLGLHNEPDLTFIINTLESIKPFLRKNQLLVLESTTYPGTTNEEIAPIIEDAGFTIGKNFFIGYSPEREDPGNEDYSTKNIPKVVSGYTDDCLNITKALYDKIVDKTIPVSSTKVAEMTKILENIHRAVNIGLVNELKIVADKMDIDIYEVIDAASTKPFGFTPYYPGPGLGGHCIPIDPFYLTWKAKEIGMNTRFIELAGEINTSMPNYVIEKVANALNKIGKSVNGSKILILGLSYKKNIDDLRESPSLEIIEKLHQLGAKIQFCDPYFKKIPPTRKYCLNINSSALNKKTLESSDLVLIATDHDSFDYKMVQENSSLIVDTRGRLNNSDKVIRA
ncbi:MAG: UDP-N-acetyl-D-glucosamine dehydrogenase [Candidatus Marinimicrobia bacterium]|nr:UDP-N-acetyl-D-glucosamine dehydrogenase [Candidatus Neomarinimicrobiota bacterium]|tara:strand:+ start:13735 stop:15039 length:1305 start_codon:yes stop_codon:yes gene_type:complete